MISLEQAEARIIRAWRQRHDYTQEGLAEALGVTAKTVRNWESGRTSPPQFLFSALQSINKGEG